MTSSTSGTSGTSSAELLADAFGRIRELVHEVAAGLGPDELAFRLDGRANSIGWLVWHLTRIQDDHLADAAGTGQIWTSQGWFERFALPFSPAATGYGHSSEEVAAVRDLTPQLLTGYHDAVHEHTVGYVAGLDDAALDRVVDRSWNPPVTLSVRLVSVIADDLQHAGQAALIRGLL
jgi:uncharacterized damage-inducible protein DinB